MPGILFVQGPPDDDGSSPAAQELARAQAGLQNLLWRLHSTSCRLLHWWAAEPRQRALPAFSTALDGSMHPESWKALHLQLAAIFERVVLALQQRTVRIDGQPQQPAG